MSIELIICGSIVLYLIVVGISIAIFNAYKMDDDLFIFSVLFLPVALPIFLGFIITQFFVKKLNQLN